MITGLSVGIDYHKDSLQVCVMNPDGQVKANRRVNNEVKAVIRAVGSFREDVTVCAEACNGSASFLDELHTETGWRVKLCHPGYAQRMRNNPDKTDKSDSELVADLTRIGYLPEVWLAPQELRDLRALVRYRATQMNESRAIKLRIRALLRNNRIAVPAKTSLWTIAGQTWLKTEIGLRAHSAWILSRYVYDLTRLQKEIKAATVRIANFVKTDPFCCNLLKHRGIGVITAAVMRAEIGTFSRFKTGKQLARFCGVSPCNRLSGEIVSDSGLIRAGNPLLKSCIAQGVWTLIRYDNTWTNFAKKLLERGKPKGVVAAAVANRWLRKLFHEVKNY